MNPNSYEFQRYYMAVLWTEYRARKTGPLGKRSWANLLLWARKAQNRAHALRKPVQTDLFGAGA